ncbi:MAG: O-antigen ligase family protein [Opitutus sp.]
MPAATVTSPQASAWEWAQTGLVALNLVWTTLCLGGYRPETLVVTSGITGAMMIVHCGHRALARTPLAPFHPAGWLLVPFAAYAAANVLWVTPVKWLGWMDWWGWVSMIAVFWVVLNGIRSQGPRVALFLTLIALALTAVLMGCYQRFVDPSWLMMGRTQSPQFVGRVSGPFGISNSMAAFILLLLPAVMALVFRRRASETGRVWWGWVALVLLVGLVLTISRGGWIALALALVLWPLMRDGGRFRRRFIAATVAFAAVILGFSLLFEFEPRTRERFEMMLRDAGELSRPIMWRAGWNLFRESPVVGTGAGSYNVRFESYRPEQFSLEPQWAHNDYLNTLSDHGATGFVLFFGAVLAMGVMCRNRRPDPEPIERHWLDRPGTIVALAVGLVAFSLQLFVEFHFKIAALAMAFATLGALVVGRRWRVTGDVMLPGPGQRVLAGAAGLGIGAAVLIAIMPLYRAEAIRYGARERLEQLVIAGPAARSHDALTRVREDLVAAVRIHPGNAQAWADLAYAITFFGEADTGRHGEFGREAETAANEALARCQVHPEYWIRRGVARDMQGRWYEAGNDFTRALVLAPSNAPAWFHHAYHLSRVPNQKPMAEAALAFCLRLDPGNSPGLALRQQLAITSKAP